MLSKLSFSNSFASPPALPAVIWALLSVLSTVCLVSSELAAESRPNVLLIVTDDQRADTMGSFMPRVQARVFDQGMTFTKAYATTPACCPSRSSILTGMYAHKHGVLRNEFALRVPTIVNELQERGYFTGIAGKYLNSWPGTPRPEFDFWSVFRFGDSSYFDAVLNIQGQRVKTNGYLTDVLRDEALRFFDLAAERSEPFFFLFTPFSPHAPADPAPGDEQLFSDLPPYNPPNFGARHLEGKPRWLREREQMSAKRFSRMETFRLRQLRTNLAVDRAVDSMLDRLAQHSMLDNTVIIYMSDHGVLWGEHGLTSKDCVYEPAIKIPFAVRYPPLVQAGVIETRQVANIDVAPTIYELTGIPVPENVDGRSLMPLLSGTATSWRDAILIEGFRKDANRRPFKALHTGHLVYVESGRGEEELYDLDRDPHQIVNRVRDKNYEATVREMRRRLRQMASLEPSRRRRDPVRHAS